MYAIFRTGDKQFRAEPGARIKVPSLTAEVGDTVAFDQVLVASSNDGLKVGVPVVEGAQVLAEVVKHGKGRKITIFKRKRRKNYRRKQGHRQKFTEVQVSEIRL